MPVGCGSRTVSGGIGSDQPPHAVECGCSSRCCCCVERCRTGVLRPTSSLRCSPVPIGSAHLATPARGGPPARSGAATQGRSIVRWDSKPVDARRHVAVICGIHGDERAMATLADGFGRVDVPADLHLTIVPHLNPDGWQAGTRHNGRRGRPQPELPVAVAPGWVRRKRDRHRNPRLAPRCGCSAASAPIW